MGLRVVVLVASNIEGVCTSIVVLVGSCLHVSFAPTWYDIPNIFWNDLHYIYNDLGLE